MNRAGKTEVLTDDLQAADKHVEQIRAALTGLSKRLGNPPNQTVTQEAFKEKRLVNILCLVLVVISIHGMDIYLTTLFLSLCALSRQVLEEE